MKKRQLNELSNEELKKRLAELRLEIAKSRGQIAIGGVPENPGKIRHSRKTIARILTKINAQKSPANKEKEGPR